jgi:AcrR family transcriptional regulator
VRINAYGATQFRHAIASAQGKGLLTVAKNDRTTVQENRNEELASVALDLFAERGFAGASIKQIARKANVNPALIYYYYKDKADLFRAAIVHAVSLAHQKYLQLLVKHDDPMGRIHAWLESNVVVAQRIRSLVKIMLDYSGGGTRNRGIDTAIREFYELERMILVESIRRGISDGVFRPTDVDRLAALISIHLDGVMVASSIRENFDMNAAIVDVKRLLTRYLGLDDDAAGEKAPADSRRQKPRSLVRPRAKKRV